MFKKSRYKSILVISDMHHPYAHPDVVAFLKAVRDEYKPDKVVCVGDEVDFHALSFHPSNVDLYSAGDELVTAINRLKPIYELFPEVDVLESNHGSLVLRKALFHGIPGKAIRGYNEILDAPKGWKWHEDLVIHGTDGQPIYFCHNKTKDILKNSQAMGMSFVCGHFHESAEIRYWGNPERLMWGMVTGCLIDKKSLAFAYNKTNLKRPIIGCAVILDSHPKLLPMVLNEHGRWIKKLV